MILLGKTCCGKSTIQNILTNDYNYDKIIEYTTRPIRPNEIQDETYHFITEEEFQDKIKSDFFIDYQSFNTIYGIWHYGFSKEEFLNNIDNNSAIILSAKSYKNIIKKYPNLKDNTYYIYIEEDVLKNRLKLRGDNDKEAKRRLEQDNIDFDGIEELVSKVLCNDGDIDDIIKEIMNE